MNLTTKIQAIFASISDEDLREAVHEIKELEERGVLPSGVVRKLRARLVETGVPETDAVKVVDSSIYRMAAYKWAGINQDGKDMSNKPTYEDLVGMLQKLTDAFAGNSMVNLGVVMYDANVMLDDAKQVCKEKAQRGSSGMSCS